MSIGSIDYPITTDALIHLFRHNLIRATRIEPTEELGVWEMDKKTWEKLAPENRPCTWCGTIMGFEIDPQTGDTCLDCTSPEGD